MDDVLHEVGLPLVKGEGPKEDGVQDDGARPDIHFLQAASTLVGRGKGSMSAGTTMFKADQS